MDDHSIGSVSHAEPTRNTERTYLAAISEACSPETWREIVARTVEDAKAGDAKARDWLASCLVGRPGNDAATLHALAVDELAGADPVRQDADLARILAF